MILHVRGEGVAKLNRVGQPDGALGAPEAFLLVETIIELYKVRRFGPSPGTLLGTPLRGTQAYSQANLYTFYLLIIFFHSFLKFH